MAAIVRKKTVETGYGDLGVTATLAGLIVTQYNRKASTQVKEITGPNGDVQSLVLYNNKVEVTWDGYISGAFSPTIGAPVGGGLSATFVDSINRTFSAEDVAKITVSATQYENFS